MIEKIVHAPSRVLTLGACLAVLVAGCSPVTHRALVRQCAGGMWLVKDPDGTFYLRGVEDYSDLIDQPVAKGVDLYDVCPKGKS